MGRLVTEDSDYLDFVQKEIKRLKAENIALKEQLENTALKEKFIKVDDPTYYSCI